MSTSYITQHKFLTKHTLLSRLAEIRHWDNNSDIDNLLERRKNWKIKTKPSGKSLTNNRFLHSHKIPKSDIKSWNIPANQESNFVKIIIAHDLNIEPTLRVFNELAENSFEIFLSHSAKNETSIPSLDKPFSDSSEFNGYYTATPSKFLIESTNDDIKISMSLEHRESIISSAVIFKKSVENGILLPAIASPFSIKELRNTLEKGSESTDHREKKWIHGIVETGNHTNEIRDALSNKFNLTHNEFTLIRYDEDYAMLALREKALKTIEKKYTV